jgi:hypothetical protein
LWVFTCATATLFVVGQRSIEVVRQVLGATFNGWLMSDGFWAYRELDQRLRCLAHLIRKARTLEDGLEQAAQRFGTDILTVLATVMAAVYDARGAPLPAGTLRARHASMLKARLAQCLPQGDAPHEKTRALDRELLNDWDTFWVLLDHPELPLTNNEAERALRHWVIARHQPGHAHRAGHPRLGAPGQCHRDLPKTCRLTLAEPGRGHSPAPPRAPGTAVASAGLLIAVPPR